MNTENTGVLARSSQTSENQTFQRDVAIDRVNYRLPVRDTRKQRGPLIILLAGSLFGIVLMFVGTWMSLAEGIDIVKQNRQFDRQFGWFLIAFGLLGLFGLIPAIGVLCWSVGALCNRSYCTIAVTTKKLVCAERALIARRHRKITIDEIHRLVVVSDLSDVRPQKPNLSNKQPVGFLMLLGSLDYHLIAETKSGDVFCVALGYPKALLMELAKDLVPRLDSEAPSIQTPIQRSNAPDTDSPHSDGIQIIDSDQVADQPTDAYQTPPEGTKIEVTRRDDGITIEIPARKDWPGAKFMKIFATIWNSFVWFMFFGTMANVRNNDFSFLFLLPFIIVGIVLLLIIRHQSTLRTTIATADDLLFVRTKSQLRERHKEWQREQIQRIGVADSNTEVNGERLQELQIHVLGAKKFGFLSQLTVEEMNWVSALLNDALVLSQLDRHIYFYRDQQDRPIPTNDSRASVNYTPGEAIISLPGKSRGVTVSHCLMGLLFTVIGIVVFAAVVPANGFAGVGIFITLWSLGFVGSGLAMLVYGFIAFKTRFEIRLAQNRLDVHRWGVLGKKQYSFTKDEIGDLKVIDTGWKNNEQSVMRLEIGRDPAKTVKIGQSRPEADLKMVATIINETLE